MKTAVACRPYKNIRPRVAYPNAATRRQMLHRFLDGVLMLASGAGIAAMVLFMLLFL